MPHIHALLTTLPTFVKRLMLSIRNICYVGFCTWPAVRNDFDYYPRDGIDDQNQKSAGAAVATVFLILAASAFVQYKPWPSPVPPAPRWGDFDNDQVWHPA
jgi:hypothetical protein